MHLKGFLNSEAIDKADPSLCFLHEMAVLLMCYMFIPKGFDLAYLSEMSLSSEEIGRIISIFLPVTNEFKLPSNLKALMSLYQMLNTST